MHKNSGSKSILPFVHIIGYHRSDFHFCSWLCFLRLVKLGSRWLKRKVVRFMCDFQILKEKELMQKFFVKSTKDPAVQKVQNVSAYNVSRYYISISVMNKMIFDSALCGNVQSNYGVCVHHLRC
jgi:hypothetical protein